MDGESTTTVNWSGLPDEAPAETTLKVSAVAAIAVAAPAAVVPRAASKVRAAPRMGRKIPILPGSEQLGGISLHCGVRGFLAKCHARETGPDVPPPPTRQIGRARRLVTRGALRSGGEHACFDRGADNRRGAVWAVRGHRACAHGVPPRVVEREPGPHTQARATAIQPGTLEILARAGVLDRVLAESVHLRFARLFDAHLRPGGRDGFRRRRLPVGIPVQPAAVADRADPRRPGRGTRAAPWSAVSRRSLSDSGMMACSSGLSGQTGPLRPSRQAGSSALAARTA